MATTIITQVFTNPEDKNIELKFRFPQDKKFIVSKMMFTLGDKTIETKVMEKEKAQEKFDDAIA